MAERLSVSVTFQNLVARVAAIEAGGGIGGGPYLPLIGGTLTGGLSAPTVTTAGNVYAGDGVFAGLLTGNYTISLRAGDATHTGYIAFSLEDGTRQGLIGYAQASGAIAYSSDNGGGHAFSGGPVSIGEGNFAMNFNAGQPTIQYDVGDYQQFTRSNNTYTWAVGGTVQASLTSSQFAITPPYLSVADNNFGLILSSGSAILSFDATDGIIYPRGANQYQFAIAAATVATLSAASFSHVAQISAPILAVDTNAYFQISAGNPIVTFDPGDYLTYNRTTNTFAFSVGSSAKALVSAGGLEASAIVSDSYVSAATYVQVGDANFFAQIVSTNPVINLDSGDCAIHYTRGGSSGFYTFTIATDQRLAITASYTFAATALFAGDTNFGLDGAALATPTLRFDTGGDGIAYTRSTNTFSFKVGGTAKATLSASAFVVSAATTLPATTIDSATGLTITNGGSGHGFVSIVPGSTTTTGSIALLDPTGSQVAAIGPMSAAGHFGLINNNGSGIDLYGGPTRFNDQAFYVSDNSGSPQIVFDTGDYLLYDRTANKLYFYVGGTAKASIDASGNMRLAGTLTQSVTP